MVWRSLRLRGDDLDFLTVGEFRHQGRDLAVDLAADRAVADIGMHGIGKIDDVGVARQRDQLALRGEAEHLVVKQLQLGVLEEFLRIGAFRKDADRVAQPSKGVGFARQRIRG